MNLLFLTSRLPFPPNRGDKVRTFMFLKELSRVHKITLVSLIESPQEIKYKKELLKFCNEVVLIHKSKFEHLSRFVLGFFNSMPFQVNYYKFPKISKTIKQLVKFHKIELIYTHLIRMAPAVQDIRCHKILDYTDAISMEYQRSLPHRKNIIKKIFYSLEAKRVRRYEQKIISKFEEAWFISDEDINYLKLQEKTKSEIEFALIGAGNFSQSVALPTLKNFKINYNTLVDHNSTVLTDIARKYNFNTISSSMKDIFENELINVVMITTPHNNHANLVMECLKSKKNVFVEKPLSINEQDLVEIKKVYEKYPKSLMVGFNRRFSTHAKKIKEFMSNSSTPLIMNYVINAGDIPSEHWVQDPKIGGGRIIGEVCHFLDFLQYISDSNPVSIFATSLKTNNMLYKNDDSLQVIISYKNGSIGSIVYHAVGDKSLPKEFFEVSAGNKTVKMHNYNTTEFYSNGHKSKYRSKKQDKGFTQEYQQFFNSIINNNPSPISFESLYLTTLSTFRIIESIKTGIALKV
ncbi:MAG: Gfo/Idh/MocA family oxidoreductase [Candidatus Cloacimonetes bacterium]|nr:Gfo/Idh/MocA family oxidoreductase [Candidatus Cloacimonadota bacterium]